MRATWTALMPKLINMFTDRSGLSLTRRQDLMLNPTMSCGPQVGGCLAQRWPVGRAVGQGLAVGYRVVQPIHVTFKAHMNL